MSGVDHHIHATVLRGVHCGVIVGVHFCEFSLRRRFVLCLGDLFAVKHICRGLALHGRNARLLPRHDIVARALGGEYSVSGTGRLSADKRHADDSEIVIGIYEVAYVSYKASRLFAGVGNGARAGNEIYDGHTGVIRGIEEIRYLRRAAGSELAAYADSLQAHFAIETGPEKAATLKGFLDGLRSTGVAVNLDPANFVMVTGDDPVQAVYTLKDYIVHTHAKDGRRLHYVEPEVLYGMVESEMLQDASFIELPLGQGDVDFPNYLKALHDIGFQGFLTIEREVGDDPEADIGLAVRFLQDLIR